MKFLYLTFILIFFGYNLNAATHTVTNGNGAGALRQIVADANSGDTIIFASNVDVVSLTNQHITINKNLTNLNSNKKTKL